MSDKYIYFELFLVFVFFAYFLYKRKKTKKTYSGYVFVGGAKSQHDKFNEALEYIRSKNINTYNRVTKNLRKVVFNSGANSASSSYLMTAYVLGDTIEVWEKMYSYNNHIDWASVIIHEALHLEGYSHGEKMNRVVKELRQSVDINR